MDTTRYDAIVIGSGIGGLTTAALLARIHGRRVLVLERHSIIGGFTHEFHRKGRFAWDVGIHYIGQMERQELPAQVFHLITGGRLQWARMPDHFERFVYPGLTFEVPRGRENYIAALKAQFPAESEAIDRYFADLGKAGLWMGLWLAAAGAPPTLGGVVRTLLGPLGRLAMTTTRDYLEARFEDERLRALIVSQWGDYGLPPAQSTFGVHAIVAGHYFDGGYYPVGGGGAIARAIVPTIEQAGGAVLGHREVCEILLEGDRAVGVRVRNTRRGQEGEEVYHAPVVVSAIGARPTYLRLLDHPSVAPMQARLRALEHGASAVTLYLGLDRPATEFGVKGENLWIFSDFDHDAARARGHETLDGRPRNLYVSFPSLKNPEAVGHTAEIITFVDYAHFERWAAQPWKRRDADYLALKDRISEGLLRLADAHCPGLADAVVWKELSTPLSVEHFTAHPRGAIYGLPMTKERLELPGLGVHTPIKGLFLSGADASSMGIFGALMGGVAAAGAIDGALGFFRIASFVSRNPVTPPPLITEPWLAAERHEAAEHAAAG